MGEGGGGGGVEGELRRSAFQGGGGGGRKRGGRERGFGVVDDVRNKVIIFITKTIPKNNTFLIELVAAPDRKGRTNCANT